MNHTCKECLKVFTSKGNLKPFIIDKLKSHRQGLRVNKKMVKSDFLKYQSEYDLRKVSVKLQRLKYFPCKKCLGCLIPSIGACRNPQSKDDMNFNQNQRRRSVRNRSLLKR